MPSLAERLRLLAREPSRAAADALIGALPYVHRLDVPEVCAALIATKEPHAVAAVIRRLHLLGRSGLPMLARAPDAFGAASSMIAADGSRQATLNLIDGLEYLAQARLIGHLSGLLTSPFPEVPQRAAAALLSVTLAHVGPTGRRRVDRASLEQLDAAVGGASDSYRTHRQRDVLLAMAMLARRPGQRVGKILSEPHHSAAFALRTVPDRVGSALVVSNLLTWLTVDALQRPVMRRLQRLAEPWQYEALLKHGHLLKTARRRQALREADRAAKCAPPADIVRQMRERAQLFAADYICSLGMTMSARARALADLVDMESPLARLKVATRLTAFRTGQSASALRRLAADPEPAIAGIAGRALSASSQDAAAVLERSSQPRCARRARAARARSQAAACFQLLEEMPDQVSFSRAGEHLRKNRAAVLEGLYGALAAEEPGRVTIAIGLTRRLHLAGELEEPLIALTRADDSRIASAAVACLGAEASIAAVEQLRVSLEHADARVRANAVEALMRAGRSGIDTWDAIEPFLASRDNRPRGNAVWAMLRLRDPAAGTALRGMLGDGDPLHRVSGIWVARRARASAVLRELITMAAQDPLPQVRTRAETARRMLGAGKVLGVRG